MWTMPSSLTDVCESSHRFRAVVSHGHMEIGQQRRASDPPVRLQPSRSTAAIIGGYAGGRTSAKIATPLETEGE